MIKAYHKFSWIWNINFFKLPAYEPNIPHVKRGIPFFCRKITSKALGALKTGSLVFLTGWKERRKKILPWYNENIAFLSTLFSCCASGHSNCGLQSCGMQGGNLWSMQGTYLLIRFWRMQSRIRIGEHCSSWGQGRLVLETACLMLFLLWKWRMQPSTALLEGFHVSTHW